MHFPLEMKWAKQRFQAEFVLLLAGKIIDLKGIFHSFKEAVKLPLLIFMSFGTLFVTILLYHVFRTLDHHLRQNSFIPFIVISHVVVPVLKLIWLTNCGERLFVEVTLMN